MPRPLSAVAHTSTSQPTGAHPEAPTVPGRRNMRWDARVRVCMCVCTYIHTYIHTAHPEAPTVPELESWKCKHACIHTYRELEGRRVGILEMQTCMHTYIHTES
jgi:hypothetical protein